MKLPTRVLGVLSALSLSVLSAPTPAANGDFTVTLNLTPSCVFVTNNLTLAYTSFQTGATTSEAGFTAQCTLNEVYHLSLTGVGLGAASGSTYAATAAGLNYTLEIQTSPGGSSVGPTTGLTGSGTTESLRVQGVVAGGQGGTCDASDTFGDAAICATPVASRTIVATF